MGKRSIGTKGHLGIFLLRLGIGVLFILHGYPKITGGVEKWEAIGGATSYVGINFVPVFFGFMASMAEFAGGILLILGLFSRPAAFFMFVTMVVATIYHISNGEGFYHSLTNAIVFLSIMLIGAGRFSLDSFLKRQ